MQSQYRVGVALGILSFALPALAQAPAQGKQQPAKQDQGKQPNQGIYVVTYIDVYPNFAEDCANALRQFQADSMKDGGAVLFNVLRDVSRSNHFAVFELWQNRQAYDAHISQPHSKQFRDKIQPMLGSPFDERLYNGL